MTPELLESLQRWAIPQLVDPAPIILHEDGVPYLLRWEVGEDTTNHHVYLHKIVDSELPERMHGHPWPNTSIVIQGRYIEHMAEGSFERVPGDVTYRDPEVEHRMELIGGEPCITLFLTGDKCQAWKDGRYAEIGDFA